MNELGKTTKEDVIEIVDKLKIDCDFTKEELVERDLKLFNLAYQKGREWGIMGNCLSDHKDWLIEIYKTFKDEK